MLSKLSAQDRTAHRRGLSAAVLGDVLPGAALAGWRARGVAGEAGTRRAVPAGVAGSVLIVFELVLTKLPHYVLPLYPAIAILTVGALERRVLSRSWLMRAPLVVCHSGAASVIAVIGAITLTRQPVFLAWLFVAAALSLDCSRGGFTTTIAPNARC